MEGVAVVGAGHIGLPWASVLAATYKVPVTCIDIDDTRVKEVNRGEAPFDEPKLDEYLETAVEAGTLTATTDPSVVADHRYIAFTINAPRNGMSEFLDTIRGYAKHIEDDHIVINRTTVPVSMIDRMRRTLDHHASGSPSFITFPERLAEGKAINEIESLPKIVGVDDKTGREAIQSLLGRFDCEIRFTDLETAMFVKLIDNSYRDALFAIANQIAFTADELYLDAHEAISLANYEYPRNDIPSPGPVGGKCLPKDPHFLTDERVCDQPTTPDLFTSTRQTNAALSSYVVTEILRRQPSKVAMCGLSYKGGIGDTYNSPAKTIADELATQGVPVELSDPHVPDTGDLTTALTDADVVVLAVNHPEFEGIESQINTLTSDDVIVYDLWGVLEREMISGTYDGFGVRVSTSQNKSDSEQSGEYDPIS
ncbi:nucleotide sugar dehydrogenase [Halorubrum trueperi]|uniref:UDP-N-acetyl-D-mannosamine dehydrogenase n=1 Tax=Halorubrum trueperi TaxID=2004704 RepID=A0ABD5UM17_9EURY